MDATCLEVVCPLVIYFTTQSLFTPKNGGGWNAIKE